MPDGNTCRRPAGARFWGALHSGGALASLANHRLFTGTPPACIGDTCQKRMRRAEASPTDRLQAPKRAAMAWVERERVLQLGAGGSEVASAGVEGGEEDEGIH